METDKKQPKRLPVFIAICIGFDSLMLFFPLLFHDLERILLNFYIPLLIWVFFICILVGFIVVSAVYFLIKRKNGIWKALAPILLNGITALLLLFTPYMQACMDLRAKIALQTNMSRYAKIITQVNAGDLQSNDKHGYIKLSSDPENPERFEDFILVDKSKDITSVFFNFETSINYSGFMYRSNDTPPPSNLMNSDWIECKHYELYWYYCSSLD